jgi:hypothetical protein
MVVIHIIEGVIYLGDYSKEKHLKEVTLDEAVEIMIKAVSQ